MKQTVYVDILIAVNLFVNYFLLAATARFLYLKFKPLRLIFGEILGAVYSLYIFLPYPGWLISSAVKLIMSFTIIAVVFEFKSLKTFLKTLLCFYSVNFAFSGIMFAAWCVLKPRGMMLNNGIVYFDISPVILITSTTICYIIFQFINRVVGKKESGNNICDVKIGFGGKFISLTAKVDTGNSLREPFSNLPVIIVRKNYLENMIPAEALNALTAKSKNENSLYAENIKFRMRMVPFKTVSGEGLLPAFKPDNLSVCGNNQKEAYVAICSNEALTEETSALISPELMD